MIRNNSSRIAPRSPAKQRVHHPFTRLFKEAPKPRCRTGIRQAVPCLLIFLTISALHAQPLIPGTLSRLSIPGTEHGYILVSMPKAAENNQPLPILFWFHGTGGKPTAQFGYHPNSTRSSVSIYKADTRYEIDDSYRKKMQRIADGLIVVGMSYPERPPETARFPAIRIWELCRQVRDQLSNITPIDLKRCYMGGFSRGGNNSFRIAIEPPRDLAGIAMFAGGVPAGYKFDPLPKFNRTFRVLICNGELDSNFWSAHIARRFFLARGAQITYDEWLGGTHASFVASRRVLDWMMAIIEPRDHTADLITEHKTILTEAVPWTRYMRLRNQLGEPRLHAADSRFPARIRTEMEQLLTDPIVKRNRYHLSTFQTMVKSEIDLFHTGYVTKTSLEAIEQQYHRFAMRFPESPWLRNALQGILRIEEYRKEEMYNKIPIPEYENPNTSVREPLQRQLEQLQQQLESAKFESANQPFNRGQGRNPVRAIEFEIQKIQTQLARIPRAQPHARQPSQPKPTPGFKKMPAKDIALKLQALPVTPISPRSSPSY